MSANLESALLITAIGMSLVFLAIILLWGLMALLVRVTADRKPKESMSEADSDAGQNAEFEDSLRMRAAAVAVAISLGIHRLHSGLSTPIPSSTISPWQSVMRPRQLKIK